MKFESEFEETFRAYGCSYEESFLVFKKDGDLSIFITPGGSTPSILLIEDEQEKKEIINYLKNKDVREFDSLDSYKKESGWDGLAKIEG